MKALVSWSGGKDCLMALAAALRDPTLDVAGLVTTVGEAFDRVSMHGVRRSLLQEQFRALRLPGHVVTIPSCDPAPVATGQGFMQFPSNDTYVPAIKAALTHFKETLGIEAVIYGDIFLEDLRAWRDGLLNELGLTGIYPLWKRDSQELLAEFVASGHKATLVCVGHERLASAWAGRQLADVLTDPAFPADVDPCGENGEFHTFVYDGPLFAAPVEFRHGEVVTRGAFTFQDLL